MTNMNPESVFEPQRWGLSAENTQSLVHRLFGFWQRFHEGFKTKTRDTSEYAHDYMIGQLRMEEKCNYTNIGCNTGVPAQNMQHFMSNSPWSAQAVIQQVQAEIAAMPELQGGVLILDESANAKEGKGGYEPGGHSSGLYQRVGVGLGRRGIVFVRALVHTGDG